MEDFLQCIRSGCGSHPFWIEGIGGRGSGFSSSIVAIPASGENEQSEAPEDRQHADGKGKYAHRERFSLAAKFRPASRFAGPIPRKFCTLLCEDSRRAGRSTVRFKPVVSGRHIDHKRHLQFHRLLHGFFDK